MHFNTWTVEISVAFKIIVFFFLLYMYVANSQINLFLNLYFIYLYVMLQNAENVMNKLNTCIF